MPKHKIDDKPTTKPVADLQHEGKSKTTKHTPGPWTANYTVVHAANDRVLCAVNDVSGRELLKEHNVHNVPALLKQEAEANARLIAAAPELLEALKAVDSILKTYGDGMFSGPCAKQIRAAISKAEGH